jgi:putative ABC transport system permease protein
LSSAGQPSVENTPIQMAALHRNSMFLRLLARAAIFHRRHTAAALLAMVVAAGAATAMLTIFVDVQAKLHKEFRSYGANVVVMAKDNGALPATALATVRAVLGPRGLAVPFAYIVARTSEGHPVVVCGTDFNQIRRLDRWWSVSAWPQAARQALLGVRAVSGISQDGKPFDLSFHGQSIRLEPAGTVETGGSEDSRVYLSLIDFENWTGVSPSTIEIAISGSSEEVNRSIAELRQALPSSEVRPIRQIVEAETRVLGKMRATLLASSLLIIVTAALCVLATLTGWVFDRRRDFAIMKALGASPRLLRALFAAEVATIGAAGAIIGFVVGVGVAAWIGRANFQVPVVIRMSVLPPVLVGSIAVSLIAAMVPMSLLSRIQPAGMLRGE